MEKFFWTENLTKRFDGLVAVGNVSLSFTPGVITAIIGPNGAGKTTFVNVCTGVLRADGGKVYFRGRDITNLPPDRRVSLGVGRTFQITNIFQGLTVRENVRIPLLSRKRRADLEEETEKLLSLLNLQDVSETLAANISHGDQKLLEMAMCLAVEPEILFLDEPLAGVTPAEKGRIIDVIFSLKERGLAVVLIEHDMDSVFKVADEIAVMHRGELIARGVPEEIKNDQRVIDVYLGGLE
ncbi:MAG: ABC transporter ATP-binding protein [Deltaproteobacteria bacterium]|nr:MAG: ABC transporter ATP-binding protein [Deltaproteobacteria bacterium]